jgi:hypothetical protein
MRYCQMWMIGTITCRALLLISLMIQLVQTATAQDRLQIIASGIGVQDQAGNRSFGHTFIIIKVPTRTGVKEEPFGFYPTKDGLGIFVGTPGALNSEWRRSPTRLAHASVSLEVPITPEQRRAVYDSMAGFNKHVYQLNVSSCVDFVKTVARDAGLPEVDRPLLQTPEAYVEELRRAYEKQMEDDRRKRAEAEAMQRAQAEQQRQAQMQSQTLTQIPGCLNGSWEEKRGYPMMPRVFWTISVNGDQVAALITTSNGTSREQATFNRAGSTWVGAIHGVGWTLTPISCSRINATGAGTFWLIK